jgi:3-isopropylmalate/(R)-2-methylmalate dehydratase small subunit
MTRTPTDMTTTSSTPTVIAPRFVRLVSTAALLPADDIDTDQIIPARFLKATGRDELGDHLFADWRLDRDGHPRPEFALNRPDAAGAEILIAGHNFGCGSSREHAVWALAGWGLRAVVASSFADIFRSNALKNRLLPVELDRDRLRGLIAAREADPALPVTIDLERQVVAWPGQDGVTFPVDPFSRRCLLEGIDELSYLLSLEAEIAAYEQGRADRGA